MTGIYKFERGYLNGGYIKLQRKYGDTSYELHRHDYYEMILYHGCDGICILNGAEYRITDNCIFLLTPKDYHRIEAKNTESSSSLIISFSENIVDSELISAIALYPRVSYSPAEKTVSVAEMLYACYSGGGVRRERRMYYLLNLLLSDILENGESAGSDNPYISQAVRKAMTTVLTDISKDVRLSELAASCGMTASYFSYLFHKETGMTFKKWLSDIRIEHARRLLEERELSVLEVCYECGYNTPSQFIKMFRRKTNCTPSEYRAFSRI